MVHGTSRACESRSPSCWERAGKGTTRMRLRSFTVLASARTDGGVEHPRRGHLGVLSGVFDASGIASFAPDSRVYQLR